MRLQLNELRGAVITLEGSPLPEHVKALNRLLDTTSTQFDGGEFVIKNGKLVLKNVQCVPRDEDEQLGLMVPLYAIVAEAIPAEAQQDLVFTLPNGDRWVLDCGTYASWHEYDATNDITYQSPQQ